MAGGCQPHRGALTWGHHEVHEAREAHEASCHDRTVAPHPSRSQGEGQTGAARSGPGGTALACREVVCHTGSGLGGSTRRAAQGDGEELYAGQSQHAWALATNLRVANSLGVLLLQLLRRLRVARPHTQVNTSTSAALPPAQCMDTDGTVRTLGAAAARRSCSARRASASSACFLAWASALAFSSCGRGQPHNRRHARVLCQCGSACNAVAGGYQPATVGGRTTRMRPAPWLSSSPVRCSCFSLRSCTSRHAHWCYH